MFDEDPFLTKINRGEKIDGLTDFERDLYLHIGLIGWGVALPLAVVFLFTDALSYLPNEYRYFPAIPIGLGSTIGTVFISSRHCDFRTLGGKSISKWLKRKSIQYDKNPDGKEM